MAGTILSFGFSPAENKKIKTVCDKVGLRLKKIGVEDYGQPIGSFLGLAEKNEAPEHGFALDGQMLVFADVTDKQLDAVFSGLRTARVGVSSLKAVLTQTNAQWTAHALITELKEEREQLGDHPNT